MVRLVFPPFTFLPPTLPSVSFFFLAFDFRLSSLSSPSVPAENAARNAVYISASSIYLPLTQHVARLPLLQDPLTRDPARMRSARIGHAQRLRSAGLTRAQKSSPSSLATPLLAMRIRAGVSLRIVQRSLLSARVAEAEVLRYVYLLFIPSIRFLIFCSSSFCHDWAFPFIRRLCAVSIFKHRSQLRIADNDSPFSSIKNHPNPARLVIVVDSMRQNTAYTFPGTDVTSVLHASGSRSLRQLSCLRTYIASHFQSFAHRLPASSLRNPLDTPHELQKQGSDGLDVPRSRARYETVVASLPRSSLSIFGVGWELCPCVVHASAARRRPA
ncbi:hypothetical protein MSAN_00480900 [Mycena sanguinolenta]|uniref:Uncharacterized protein n=1 Tax=Mycena sanguinolenta TaxID=230812 RepID=A0A8H6Z550_9AGAR|nr:hypothetical protein MSAN_00480900 [Mycena sanguinolenta]